MGTISQVLVSTCSGLHFLAAGCGFLDTVTKLIKLGSDVNARDLTQCTPLQNAAHGTYSALATMPLNGSQGGASGVMLHLNLVSSALPLPCLSSFWLQCWHHHTSKRSGTKWVHSTEYRSLRQYLQA